MGHASAVQVGVFLNGRRLETLLPEVIAEAGVSPIQLRIWVDVKCIPFPIRDEWMASSSIIRWELPEAGKAAMGITCGDSGRTPLRAFGVPRDSFVSRVAPIIQFTSLSTSSMLRQTSDARS